MGTRQLVSDEKPSINFQKELVIQQIVETLRACETPFLCDLLSSLRIYGEHPQRYDQQVCQAAGR